MAKRQKAFILWVQTKININDRTNLNELNCYLEDGWKVISQAPMGGKDDTVFLSLVIIEKDV